MAEKQMETIGEVLSGNWNDLITTTTLSKKDTDESVVESVNKERRLCKNCTGAPCRKPFHEYTVPAIFGEGEEARSVYSWCKFKPRKSVYRRALIPPKYVGKTFEDYTVTTGNKKAVDGAKWFLDNKATRGLYLFGDVGTGKTFLAALIAQEYAAKGKTVIFGDVPSLLADLKATFGKGGTEDLLNRYYNCALLILDDIGAGKVTDWNVGILYQIVNARYNADKLTIATSNCDFNGLEDVLAVRDSYGRTVDALTGKRIVSRLKEMTYPILLEGNDRRS